MDWVLGVGSSVFDQAAQEVEEALRRKAEKKKRKAAEKKRRLLKSTVSFTEDDGEDHDHGDDHDQQREEKGLEPRKITVSDEVLATPHNRWRCLNKITWLLCWKCAGRDRFRVDYMWLLCGKYAGWDGGAGSFGSTRGTNPSRSVGDLGCSQEVAARMQRSRGKFL